MKKLILPLAAYFLISAPMTRAEAPLTPTSFIAITTDATPGETYHMGYLLDQSSTIAGVFYENQYAPDPVNKLKSFSMADILKGTVLIQKENGGKIYELVRGQASLQTDNTYRFTLDYLKNAVFGSRDNIQFGVRFSAPTGRFEAFHLTTHKTILGAQIFVKYLGAQAVGVDRVVFQYASAKKQRRAFKAATLRL